MSKETNEVTDLQADLRDLMGKLVRRFNVKDFPNTDAEAIAHLARAHRDLTH